MNQTCKKIGISLFIVCQAITTAAQKKNPKWMENATKAIFSIEATTAEGTTQSGSGFFIREDGEAVAPYDPFKNAVKAVVTTSTGEKYNVTKILGADDLYGVVRFKVAVPKKTAFLTVATVAPGNGVIVQLPPSPQEKNWAQGEISEVTKIKGTYDYYKVEKPLPESQAGFPLLTETGEAFALTQADATGKNKTYGIAIPYIQSLQVTTTDILKRAYSDIGIRKAWTSNVDEALVSLMLYSSQQDPQTYLETVSDFIETFPDCPDGYINRATHYAYNRNLLASDENERLQLLDMALNDLDQSAKYNTKKGDVYYEKAKLIFNVAASDSTLQYKDWNLEEATNQIQKAIAEEDRPEYRQLEGDIALYNQDFEKAFEAYSIVNQSPVASGASFYLAAKCKQQIPGSNYMEVIALMDSAIAKSPDSDAAAYILESVELKMQVGLYEEAVKGYDKYYVAAGGRVNDGFYYYREQAKFRKGDLEGALQDINSAIAMNDKNAIYHAEKASIFLRMQDLPNAQTHAEYAIQIDPEFASAYRILGLSLVRQDKKEKACEHFQKALELGDRLAERLITEHCASNTRSATDVQ